MTKIKELNDAIRLTPAEWGKKYAQVLIELSELEKAIQDGWKDGRYTVDERNELASFVRREIKKFAERGTYVGSVLFRYDRHGDEKNRHKLLAVGIRDEKKDDADARYVEALGQSFRIIADDGERFSSEDEALSAYCEKWSATERRSVREHAPAMFPTENGADEYDVGAVVDFYV